MKFQNPSLNYFLNGQKDGRTNERTSRNQYAPHFFKVGGIKIGGGVWSGGGGVMLGWGQGGGERRIFVKNSKKKIGGGSGRGGGRGRLVARGVVQGGSEWRSEVFVKAGEWSNQGFGWGRGVARFGAGDDVGYGVCKPRIKGIDKFK